MGAELYRRFSAARDIFRRADELLPFSVTRLCFEGPEADLADTVYQQPAVYTVSYAAWRTIRAGNWPRPRFVAGHSLGEITALAAAGALTFEDGLRLVSERGRLMQEAGRRAPGGMLAVLGLQEPQMRAIVDQAVAETERPLAVANDNCPGQIVLSGDDAALGRAAELAKQSGARKTTRLNVSIAAHSRLMAVVGEAYAAVVDALPVQSPTIPIVSNRTAEPLADVAEIREELKAQLVSPVRWTESMRYLVAEGVSLYVDVGPGNVLSKLMRRIDRGVTRHVFDSFVSGEDAVAAEWA